MASLVIEVTDSEWTNISDELSLAAGVPLTAFNKSGFTNLFCVTSPTEPTEIEGMPIWERGQQYIDPGNDNFVWMRAVQGTAKVYVTTEAVSAAIQGFLLTTFSEVFARLKTQNLTIGQQQVLDGVAFETNWIEQNTAVSSSKYAEFSIPSGFKMVLALRILNPSGDSFLYRVYPEGTYTLGAAKVDDAHNFAKTRNLNQGSGFVVNPLIRYNVSVVPAETAQIIYDPSWGQINAGNRSVGGLDNDDSYLLLNGNQKFLLEARNNGTTNPMNTQVLLQYAFVPESRIPPPIV